jgi:hypothetical protein
VSAELEESLGLDFGCYEEWEDYLADYLSDYGHNNLELVVTVIAQHWGVKEDLIWADITMTSQVAAECDNERRHERRQLYGGQY